MESSRSVFICQDLRWQLPQKKRWFSAYYSRASSMEDRVTARFQDMFQGRVPIREALEAEDLNQKLLRSGPRNERRARQQRFGWVSTSQSGLVSCQETPRRNPHRFNDNHKSLLMWQNMFKLLTDVNGSLPGPKCENARININEISSSDQA